MTGTQPARAAVAAWGFWDWAFSACNAVATTGVITFGGVLGHVAFGLSTKHVLVSASRRTSSQASRRSRPVASTTGWRPSR